MDRPTHPNNPIVVGVDGSAHSFHALDWACRYAKAFDAPLTILTSWHIPASYAEPIAIPVIDLEESAKSVSEHAATRTKSEYPGLAFTAVVAQGDPGVLLTEASRTAALIVVGSRGHNGVTSVLLGSVSIHCVHHAHCPVVVIRGDVE